MTTNQQQKLDQLQKALGSNAISDKIGPNLGMGEQALPQKNNIQLQFGNKFDSGNAHDAKSLKDPKGKNKQVLKGNSKARR